MMAVAGSPAHADDWSGFYIGANAGLTQGNVAGSGSLGINVLGFGTSIDQNDSFDLTYALTGGLQAGYNRQNGSLVFGLETDFNLAGLSTPANAALVSVPYLEPGCNIFKNDCTAFLELGAFSTEVEWFGTARGRVGKLLDDNIMVYATGGLAYGKVTSSIGISNTDTNGATTSIASESSSDTQLGYTVGGGVETRARENITVKLEYLYVDLGAATFLNQNLLNLGALSVDSSAAADVNFHVLRAGVNIHFDSPL